MSMMSSTGAAVTIAIEHRRKVAERALPADRRNDLIERSGIQPGLLRRQCHRIAIELMGLAKRGNRLFDHGGIKPDLACEIDDIGRARRRCSSGYRRECSCLYSLADANPYSHVKVTP